MFATFCLAYVDIAYRIGTWLGELNVDWSKATVLVSGQSGRPTAGPIFGGTGVENYFVLATVVDAVYQFPKEYREIGLRDAPRPSTFTL
jgi:hypothetical protein